MTEPGIDHPAADSSADVTSLRSALSVDARVEFADRNSVLVRPSAGDFVGQDVVAVGEPVEVFWHGPAGGRALSAEVAHVERGRTPRWHLTVTGPADDRQRRTAVRCRLGLPVTVTLRGVDLAGETLDLSEDGTRVLVEGYGAAPEPGTPLGVTVELEDGAARYRAESLRVRSRGISWVMSLRFLETGEREQDRLRRRVFQALREERARPAAG
jgi:hypothetical protein